MLMVYYEGDATAEVEGHFTRAMKEASSSSTTTTEGERKRGEQCNIILASMSCLYISLDDGDKISSRPPWRLSSAPRQNAFTGGEHSRPSLLSVPRS